MKHFAAIDLGAESGRLIYATVCDGKVDIEEIHRFPTVGLKILDTRYWNYARIYDEIVTGLEKCVREKGSKLDGIAIDTWGVDFALLDCDGRVLANPVQYRDSRTDGMIDAAHEQMSKQEIFNATGISTNFFNTLYQMMALVQSDSPWLAIADDMLLMPDLFAYLLCGTKSCELTIASTTQLLDVGSRQWSEKILDVFDIPKALLPEPTMTGKVLGPILPEIAQRTGLDPETLVISTAGHDTACAFAAVPCEDSTEGKAILSCGTWSLLGAELDAPNRSVEACEANFTNEIGFGGKIRFLKNIIGLWLIQECFRKWSKTDSAVSYANLTSAAADSDAFVSLINVDDPRLAAPDDMEKTIQTICSETSQPMPKDRGAMTRCILESLAINYALRIADLDTILGRKSTALHMIGGGIQNQLLCQMTADACNLEVIAGPVEATAMGNVTIQAISTGEFTDLQQARKAIARSTEVIRYYPINPGQWQQHIARFR